MRTIPSAKLKLAHLPPVDAGEDSLIEFAHTFAPYTFWGSAERAAEIAKAEDHGSIDKIRTRLFVEVREWHFSSEDPDAATLQRWRSMVATIRDRLRASGGESVEWLIAAIDRLPYDERVPDRTPGYNAYNTQKDHWLGWLNPAAGTGSYSRKTSNDRGARGVYNRIVEPKMLLWLISAAGVPPALLRSARQAADAVPSLATKAAAIRKHVPWEVVAEALRTVARDA